MEDIWALSGGNAKQTPRAQVEEPMGAAQLIEDLVPLDAQSDTVEPLCVIEALRAPLFGPVGDAEPATFAILDAAKIPNLSDLLEAAGLEHKCLFTGEALETLGDVAPWIVKLEDGNRFVRRLFTQGDPPTPWDLWDKDAGIYLRSEADLEALWAHFRKFTKVRVEDVPEGAQGDWQYFRFYEPEQAAIYFDAIRGWPDRMVQFFSTKDGAVVDAVIAISSVAGTAHIFQPGTLPDEKPQAFIFQPRDAEVFEAARRPSFRKELYDWLLRMDEARFKPFSEEQLYALVDHGLREGDALRFSFKDEYVYLLYMMSYFGGWFHKSGRVPEIARILVEDGRARRANLEPAFLRAHDALIGDPATTYRHWAQLFGQLDAHLAKSGGWGSFTPDSARRLIATATQHLAEEDRERLGEFLRRVELDCDQRGVTSPPGRAVVLLFSYFMGHGFFEDPLFPWAVELAAEHDTLEPALPAIADYAMKRGRKMLLDFQKSGAGAA